MRRSAAPLHKPQTIIRPASKIGFFDVREIWRYRELLYMLAVRDIQLRYKQTAFGRTFPLMILDCRL
jgi:lipopolysaccharide transport system permease protein